ncbi:hypothetical protein NK529_002958 [Citrobacter amalonaticus]|nr:hypothetical protein [Citrobacter amalonaticus]
MNTITKERVAAIIHAAGLEPCDYEEVFGSIKTGEIVAMARIALASLEAEPVAWTDADELRDAKNGGNGYLFAIGGNANKFADPRRQMMLYAASPAPVVPEELLSAMEEVLRISDRDHEAWHKARNGIVSCRAAMLQGAEPVTTAYKLPDLKTLDTVKFNADCALQDPESIYAQEFFMSIDEAFGERGNYTEPVQAKAVSILIAEIFRLRGYPAAPQQEVK